MTAKCLKCARMQQQKGYKVCQDCYDIIWSLLIQNFSADLDLTKEQTDKLIRLSEEAARVLKGAGEMGMTPGEFAEYVAGKAAECKERLEGWA